MISIGEYYDKLWKPIFVGDLDEYGNNWRGT
jgi:hypothetical protein